MVALALGASLATITAPAASAASSWSVPVLMYHHVRPISKISSTVRLPGLYVDSVMFDKHMAALKDWGWKPITTRELTTAMKAGEAVPPRSIIITFDDGRGDNYDYAYPILEKYGFRGVFYIVGDRVGDSGSMTAAELKEMAADGHEIANHTWTHPDLRTLSYDSMRSQIRRTNDLILSLTGKKPVSIAYPYGDSNSTVRSAANAEGMYLGFVTDDGYRITVERRLDLHRVRVAGVHRNSDGSYSGGTTATGLLTMIASYQGPLVTKPVSKLVSGSTLGSSTVPVRTTWTAKDPTGISSNGLRRQQDDGTWNAVSLSSATSTSSTQSLAIGPAWQVGARSTNKKAVTSAWAYGPTFLVSRFQETSSRIEWSDDWSLGLNDGYSGGQTRYTSTEGAEATFTFTGRNVGWVSKLGPTRGSADVYVDGVLKATVSTYASSYANREIVFTASWSSNGEHSVRIVARGTDGHARVDIDAFVVIADR